LEFGALDFEFGSYKCTNTHGSGLKTKMPSLKGKEHFKIEQEI
jgi:hypothetical protein